MRDYTHLSITDRRRLSVFLEMGFSMTEITKRLSRSRSTLYRELNRNKEVTSKKWLFGARLSKHLIDRMALSIVVIMAILKVIVLCVTTMSLEKGIIGMWVIAMKSPISLVRFSN